MTGMRRTAVTTKADQDRDPGNEEKKPTTNYTDAIVQLVQSQTTSCMHDAFWYCIVLWQK